MTDKVVESEQRCEKEDSVPFLAPGIGARISEVATVLGTRRNAALVAGVSPDTLQRYLREEVGASLEPVARMAAAAGYSLDWIAFNRGSKKVGSAPGTFPALNEEVLVEVIAVLEAVIQERHVAMTPEKKAQLTVLLYEELAGQGAAEAVPNMERILRLVKLAAG